MWEKTKQYAIEDSNDALKLYDLMIPAKFYLTQSVPKSFQEMGTSATGSQVNSMLVRSYLQNGHSIAKATEITESVAGGISFAVPGVYKNLLKADLKSCYPSQIIRFKLSDPIKDPQSNFYKMVHHFTYERFDLKKQYKLTGDKYYYDREQASKVFINSSYGATITQGLNYNCPWIGAKITEESRKVIDQALIWASGRGKDSWMREFREKTGHEVEDEA
jgi:DNA polymerase elongation subunit (family B)